MRLLNNCIEQYQSTFPVDWIESFDWSDTSMHITHYTDGLQRINDYIVSCFEIICKSVIAGEYEIRTSSILSYISIHYKILSSEVHRIGHSQYASFFPG